MGVVYEAVQSELERTVAVKTLLPGAAGNDEAFKRFRREAQAASKLRHPHIVEVIDFYSDDSGPPCMIMEFLEGEDLGQTLEREGRLPLQRFVPIFKKVCSAIQTAHDNNIIHRDLKPNNLFLCRYGDIVDFPKVLDFGISKILDASTLTGANELIGTPLYMAPEQAKGGASKVDARADLYALGAILYRALGGRDVFQGEDFFGVLRQIVQEAPEPLLKHAPHIPPAVARVVHQALSKRPRDRFTSATELADALVTAAGVAAGPGAAIGPAGSAGAHGQDDEYIGNLETLAPDGAEQPHSTDDIGYLETLAPPDRSGQPIAPGSRFFSLSGSKLAGVILAMAVIVGSALWLSRGHLLEVTDPAEARGDLIGRDRSPDGAPRLPGDGVSEIGAQGPLDGPGHRDIKRAGREKWKPAGSTSKHSPRPASRGKAARKEETELDVEQLDQMQSLLRRAVKAFGRETPAGYREAARLCRQVLKLDSRQWYALQLLGASSCYLGRADDARWALERMARDKRALVRKACQERGISLGGAP